MNGFYTVLLLGLMIFVTCPADQKEMPMAAPEPEPAHTTNEAQTQQAEMEEVPPPDTPETRWARFCEALAQVESGGDDEAVGDLDLAHKAYGRYQIREPFLIDSRTGYGIDEMKNPQKAQEAMRRYYKRYLPYTLRSALELDSRQSWKNLAALHNGGPSGKTSSQAIGHAVKVMAVWDGLTGHSSVVH